MREGFRAAIRFAICRWCILYIVVLSLGRAVKAACALLALYWPAPRRQRAASCRAHFSESGHQGHARRPAPTSDDRLRSHRHRAPSLECALITEFEQHGPTHPHASPRPPRSRLQAAARLPYLGGVSGGPQRSTPRRAYRRAPADPHSVLGLPARSATSERSAAMLNLTHSSRLLSR